MRGDISDSNTADLWGELMSYITIPRIVQPVLGILSS